MLFNTLEFARFFAVAFVVTWALGKFKSARLIFLLLASYYFYSRWDVGWGNNPILRFVPLGLVFASSTIDYLLALRIDAEQDPIRRKRWLIITVIVNLGLLGFFKYYNFSLETLKDIVGLLSPSNAESFSTTVKGLTLKLALPIGISFYTFESMSYVIDVYRREMPACRSYLNYLLFVAYFPHLVAGPIVRPRDLIPQLGNIPTELDSTEGGRGMFLVASGLLKKVVIGDFLAVNLVDRVFDRTTTYSSVETLAGVYGYAFQIYCDFSGYTDIAIGCALLLGVKLNKNFASPYQSTSIQEFWRRWHISLSSWLRDYLYISLGGNRGSRWATYRNLMLTMLLGGLWHGASWTFVFWGFLHGAALAAHRFWEEFIGPRKTQNKSEAPAETSTPAPQSLPLRAVKMFLTFHFVCLCWVFFRAESFSKAITVLKQIAQGTTFHPNLPPKLLAILALGVITHLIPDDLFEKMKDKFAASHWAVQGVFLFVAAVILREATSTEAVPFIYFQF